MKSLSSKKHEKGQGLVEYALILVLVAIVVIAAMTLLGPRIGNIFSSVNTQIAGGSWTTTGDGQTNTCTGSISCPPGQIQACMAGGVIECIPY